MDINNPVINKDINNPVINKDINNPTISKDKYICSYCNKSYNTGKVLKSHIRNMHTCNTCKTCGEEFYSRYIYYRHLDKHGVKYECNICGALYIEYSNLQRHIKNHKKEDKIYEQRKCIVVDCNKEYKYLNELKKHIIVEHLNKRVYKCNILMKPNGIKYLSVYTLGYVSESEPEYVICNKSFVSYSDLVKHIGNNHNKRVNFKANKCIVVSCNMEFKYLYELKNHIIVEHLNIRTYTCTYGICNKQYSDNSSLNRHIRNIHKKGDKIHKSYKCIICDKQYSNTSGLHRHIKTKHLNKCDITENKINEDNINSNITSRNYEDNINSNITSRNFKDTINKIDNNITPINYEDNMSYNYEYNKVTTIDNMSYTYENSGCTLPSIYTFL